MSMLIAAQDIFLRRADRIILEHVNIELHDHSFTTIIGPNGAGKTMLLQVLLGIEQASNGSVYRKDGLKVGYVPQKMHISHEIPMRSQELVSLNRSFDKKSYKTVIEQLDIGSLMQQQVAALSGGELQRVLLARALLGRPEILILDEPDQNFDLPAQLSFYSLIQTLYQEHGYAILMVSHNLHLVMSATEEVYCLNRHFLCSGSPHHVRNSAAFVELFGAEIAENLAVFHHDVTKHEYNTHE